MTFEESKGDIEGKTLAWLGDGNNVANSLMLIAALMGVKIRIACPKGYEPNALVMKKAYEIYNRKDLLKVVNDPLIAASGAKGIYTDVWSSMGEENQKETKDRDFIGFTVDKNLVSKANENAIVLHCLPAYRGKEIDDEIFESKKSRIFEQAENRMHVQQALLSCLL